MEVSSLTAVLSSFVAGMALIFAISRALFFSRGEGVAVRQAGIAMQEQIRQLTTTINGDLQDLKVEVRRLADKLDMLAERH